MGVEKIRYDRHPEEWDRVLRDPDRARVAETWLRTDTLDAWRHDRMREPLIPLIRALPQASWLTVGDGRYGTDANWLLRNGAEHVHASDVSDTLLKIGAAKGFIGAFSAQNAEALGFPDASFDFVLCKEALHHFPRPFVALYEMFRVARRAVVLIEPRDVTADRALFAPVLEGVRWLLGRRTRHGFEPVGNYVYTISEYEIEKFLLGMHYRDVAFLGLNDHYIHGAETVPRQGGSTADAAFRRRLKRWIKVFDMAELIGLRNSRIILATLFCQPPDAGLVQSLSEAGWRVRRLPANPYRDRAAEEDLP
jgi:ubiquinone/menaquinone biosynthesis C-methylase UbiE